MISGSDFEDSEEEGFEEVEAEVKTIPGLSISCEWHEQPMQLKPGDDEKTRPGGYYLKVQCGSASAQRVWEGLCSAIAGEDFDEKMKGDKHSFFVPLKYKKESELFELPSGTDVSIVKLLGLSIGSGDNDVLHTPKLDASYTLSFPKKFFKENIQEPEAADTDIEQAPEKNPDTLIISCVAYPAKNLLGQEKQQDLFLKVECQSEGVMEKLKSNIKGVQFYDRKEEPTCFYLPLNDQDESYILHSESPQTIKHALRVLGLEDGHENSVTIVGSDIFFPKTMFLDQDLGQPVSIETTAFASESTAFDSTISFHLDLGEGQYPQGECPDDSVYARPIKRHVTAAPLKTSQQPQPQIISSRDRQIKISRVVPTSTSGDSPIPIQWDYQVLCKTTEVRDRLAFRIGAVADSENPRVLHYLSTKKEKAKDLFAEKFLGLAGKSEQALSAGAVDTYCFFPPDQKECAAALKILEKLIGDIETKNQGYEHTEDGSCAAKRLEAANSIRGILLEAVTADDQQEELLSLEKCEEIKGYMETILKNKPSWFEKKGWDMFCDVLHLLFKIATNALYLGYWAFFGKPSIASQVDQLDKTLGTKHLVVDTSLVVRT